MGAVQNLVRRSAAETTGTSGAVATTRPSGLALVEIFALVIAIGQILVLEIIGKNRLVAFGPVNIQIVDFAMLAFPLLFALLIATRVRFPVPVLLFLLLYAIAFARGIAASPSAVLNSFRYDVMFIMLMASFATGAFERIGYERVRAILNIAAVIVAAVSISRLIFGPNFMVDLASVDIEIADDWNDGRTLGAAAIIIVITAIILNIAREYGRGLKSPRLRFDLLTLFLLVIVATSGQRTALLGFVIALGLMAINRIRPVAIGLLAIIPIALFAIMTGIADVGPAIGESVGDSLGGRSGTFQFRMAIWQAFIESMNEWSGTDYLFGLPLGQRPEFYLLQRLWTASLHSAYIGLIPLIGVPGTILFVLSLVLYTTRALFGFIRQERSPWPPGFEIKLFFAAIVYVYGVSYEWRGILGLLIGCVIMGPSPHKTMRQRAPENIGAALEIRRLPRGREE